MPRNPSGTFTRVTNDFSNPVLGDVIDPVAADVLWDDYDSGLTDSLSRSGEGAMQADLNLGTHKITNGATGSGFTVDFTVSNVNGGLPAAAFPALIGDVTTTAGSLATTIGAGKVSNTMLAGSIAASKLVGTDIATVGTITAGIWNGMAVSVANGGTGSTSAAAARTALGLGTMATQAASAVTITGGAITGMPTPTVGSDVATKTYADSIASGLSVRTAVSLATTANLTRSGEQTIDGVLTSTTRLLVKNQSAPAENGIFNTAAGAWTRATDFDSSGEMVAGAAFLVLGGTTNIGTGWVLATSVAVINTDPVNFNQYQSITGALLAASNLSDLANAATARTNLGLAIGTNVQAFDSDLAALAANSTNGFWARTGSGTGSALTLTGTANEITITHGVGDGTPIWSLPTALTFTGKTVTGGTYASITHSGSTAFPGNTTITSSGVYGGGTGSPRSVGVGIDAAGTLAFTNTANVSGVDFASGTWTGAGGGVIGWNKSSGEGEVDLISVSGGGSDGGFALYDRNTQLVRILKNGYVGIGVTPPTAQLHTTGTVRFAALGAGFLATDASGNISVSAGTGGVGSTGGILGQQIYKYSATNGQANWFTPGEFNIASDPLCDTTGATASDTAFDNAFTNNNTVLIPPGCTVRLSNDHAASISASKTLIIANGGFLKVDTAKTVTVRGIIQAGVYQIFNGVGSVIGMKLNRPEWWGAANNGSTNDLAALNSAWTSVAASGTSAGDRPTIQLASGSGYNVTGQWTVSPSFSIPLAIIGAGTSKSRIIADATFSGTSVVQVNGQTADGTTEVMDLKFSGWAIYSNIAKSAGGTNARGITFGSINTQIQGVKKSIVEDFESVGFAVPLYIANTRVIKWERCGFELPKIDGAVGIQIDVLDSSNNTADLEFETVQVVPYVNGIAETIAGQKDVFIRTAAGGTGVNGIYFDKCTFYPTRGTNAVNVDVLGDTINATDIFFRACQFEGGTTINGCAASPIAGLQLRQVSGGEVYDVHVTDCYFQGITGHGIYLNAAAADKIYDVTVSGNFMRGLGDDFLSYLKVRNVSTIGNTLSTSPTNEFIKVDTSVNCSFVGNVAEPRGATGASTYFIVVAGTSDYITASSNAAGAASSTFAHDTSGGTHNSGLAGGGSLGNWP